MELNGWLVYSEQPINDSFLSKINAVHILQNYFSDTDF
jgi:hypothetical protein